jgi:hypothetical protein
MLTSITWPLLSAPLDSRRPTAAVRDVRIALPVPLTIRLRMRAQWSPSSIRFGPSSTKRRLHQSRMKSLPAPAVDPQAMSEVEADATPVEADRAPERTSRLTGAPCTAPSKGGMDESNVLANTKRVVDDEARAA